MRLNKFMATAGVASRRKCDDIIASGRVRVNAKVVKKLGTVIDPQRDLVTVDNKPIRVKGDFIYIMLNKPTGVVTTVKDPYGRPTVIKFVEKLSNKKRVYPVGRLDYNSSGLLLFTNDGDTAQKLIHPSFALDKVYMVTTPVKLNEGQISALRKGVDIGGFVTSPAKVEYVREDRGMSVYKIIIHEGKNRQIRRMIEAVGSKVVALSRVAIGKITLGNLEVGKSRFLTEDEVSYILKLGE